MEDTFHQPPTACKQAEWFNVESSFRKRGVLSRLLLIFLRGAELCTAVLWCRRGHASQSRAPGRGAEAALAEVRGAVRGIVYAVC